MVELDDPFDVIAHLLVGSEGTLAFLSEVTMRTEPDYKNRKCANLFPNTDAACHAVIELKKRPVSAVELFDYKALASVKETVEGFETLPSTTIALLVKVDSDTQQELSEK